MGTWWPALTAAAVVLVTTLLGMLSNWGKRPGIISSPARYWTVFAVTVLVAVALAVVQAVAVNPVAGRATPTSTDSSTATGAAPSRTGAVQFLDQLPVDLGTANVQRTLPRALAGRPGYDQPLVIACATGQPTDRFREVRYALFKRYLSLTATVYAYESTPDESLVQVRLFRDSRPPVDRTLAVGTSNALTLDVDGVDNLVIRVTCQAPSAMAILANARLQHV